MYLFDYSEWQLNSSNTYVPVPVCAFPFRFYNWKPFRTKHLSCLWESWRYLCLLCVVCVFLFVSVHVTTPLVVYQVFISCLEELSTKTDGDLETSQWVVCACACVHAPIINCVCDQFMLMPCVFVFMIWYSFLFVSGQYFFRFGLSGSLQQHLWRLQTYTCRFLVFFSFGRRG